MVTMTMHSYHLPAIKGWLITTIGAHVHRVENSWDTSASLSMSDISY